MKILLIEDDRFFQNFYLVKLKESGFEVEAASDGEEGIAKVQTFQPDLILLDIIMPKKNGYEVLEDLSQMGTLKTTPVLVFSTLGQEQDVQKAKNLGATDYVNKSFFDFDTLLTKIKSFLTAKTQ